MNNQEDQYTEITTRSWFSRIIGSVTGIMLGMITLGSGCWLLYYNESKLDYSQLAAKAMVISPQKLDFNAIDKLVTVTGNLRSERILGDDLFLRPAPYIGVERTVEMFSWIEKREQEAQRNIGGSETVKTTYTYFQEWQEDPPSSKDFYVSSGHENPPKNIDNFEATVNLASVGIYSVNLDDLIFKLRYKRLNLTPEKIYLKPNIKLIDNYLFLGKGTYQKPIIGDLRISYAIIPNNLPVTVFGKLEDGQKIVPYFNPRNKRFYRIIEGNYLDAVALLSKEYWFALWGFRFVGFCLIWLGLNVVFEPINVLFDLVPVMGNLSRVIIRVITFIGAIIISVTIIFSSAFIHHGSFPIISSSFFSTQKNHKLLSSVVIW